MSLEAIEKVTQVENKIQERKAAAEVEARQIVADAERNGLALLQQVRAGAAEDGKKLLRQAEEKAAGRAAEIGRAAEAESAALREAAGKHLEEAAEFIVGRVESTEMAIVKMKKLRVIAMADRRDELLKGLLHLGCVEISEPDGKLADPGLGRAFEARDLPLGGRPGTRSRM